MLCFACLRARRRGAGADTMVSRKLTENAAGAKRKHVREGERGGKGGRRELDVVDRDADGLQKVVNDSL